MRRNGFPHEGLLRRALACAAGALCLTSAGIAAEVLDPLSLTKYVDPLPVPGAMPQAAPDYYEIGAYEVVQQVHSQLPPNEMWEVVNMTGDAHPIHLHLVQFQLLDRQRINIKRYERAWEEANPEIPAETYVEVPVGPYLQGKPRPADANERGWKDTFRMNPGEVTRVIIRFAPQDDSPGFTFDATAEPGYVWHCHILEHEENDMMRPYHLVPAGAAAPAVPVAVDAVTVAPAVMEQKLVAAPRLTAEGPRLRFTLADPGQIDLDIYDVAGRRVKSLASGWFPSGEHTVAWQSPEGSGGALGSGVYFVRLRGEALDLTQKLVVAR